MKSFIKDLTERAIKAFFHSLSGSLIGVAVFEPIEWYHALTVSAISMIISICSSMADFHFNKKGTVCLINNISDEEENNDV